MDFVLKVEEKKTNCAKCACLGKAPCNKKFIIQIFLAHGLLYCYLYFLNYSRIFVIWQGVKNYFRISYFRQLAVL